METNDQEQRDLAPEESQAYDRSEMEPGNSSADDEDVEEEEIEEQTGPRVRRRSRSNLVMTIVFGLAMFVLGGFAGYWGRPFLTPPPPDPRQAMLDSVIKRTRHFKGNANAPVTMIEFSDYQ